MKKRKYKIVLEKEVEVELDMSLYGSKEIIQNVNEYYWSYDLNCVEEKEELLEEVAKMTAYNYVFNNMNPGNIEGLAINGQTCKERNENIEVDILEECL